ncbi:hypothetical protein [Caenispirillum salinarum]|uniref:hypothetical protein n=1 Tax=Caenispirillum salinarum TaxID=859058 RepID=UPI00384C7233
MTSMTDSVFAALDPDECRALGRDMAELLLAGLKGGDCREVRPHLARYDADAGFRNAFRGLVEALGGDVLDNDPTLGIVIGVSTSTSPLLDRVEMNLSAKDRRLMGVAIAAILALYYTEDVETDPTAVPRPLSVEDVFSAVAEIVDTMRAAARNGGSDDEIEMWRVVEENLSLEPTPKGRYTAGSVAYAIDKAFRTLEKRRLVKERQCREGRTEYQATLLLGVFVRERLNHHLFIEIRAALSGRSVKGDRPCPQ